jgi:parallel beta-helix repeat protein
MFLAAVRKLLNPKPTAPIVRSTKSSKLKIESLEDRTVPTVFTVNPGQSIQAAVNAAHPGDTVNLNAGTYNQTVILSTSNVTLQANCNVTLQPTSANAVTLSGKNIGAAVIDVYGQNDKVTGFTVDGSKETDGHLYAGIRVIEGGSATISNDTVEGLINGSATTDVDIQVGTSVQGPLDVASAGTAVIHNNSVLNYAGAGILVDGTGAAATIEYNTITGRGTANKQVSEYGVQVSNFATVRVQSNTISGNTIYGSAGAPNNPSPTSAGVFFYNDGDKMSVAALNTVYGNDDGILVQNSNGACGGAIAVVNNDVFENYGYAGIFILNSNNVAVAANYVFSNTTFNGIALNGSKNVLVSSNDVGSNGTSTSGTDGIYDLDGCNNQLIANNSYDNTGNGINLNYTSGDQVFNDVTWSNTLDGIQDLSGSNDAIWLGEDVINAQNGIILNGTNGDTVVGNVLLQNTMYGLYLMGAKNTLVAENLVANNGAGSIYIDSNSTGTVLIANWTSSPPIKDGTSGASGSSSACNTACSNADNACGGLNW